jgi:AAA+ ATPase superfamily predicted ATPase
MFIGRKTELEKLNELYQSGKFECVVIYGRRRVGKTTLINEFIKDKNSIFFTGLESNAKENLESLSKSIMTLYSDFESATPVFENYSKALDGIYNFSREKHLIMVIDEYPYLASSYKTISSLLQEYIDKKYINSKLYLILCGSSLSFMENQVLGYQSPLYGRRTSQFKIKPFEFSEAKEYYSHFDIYDSATIYGITGGIPQYMTKIDDTKSIVDNIKNNFLDPTAYLFEEPSNLVKQECREPAQYNSIIKAIATGSSRLSEIANRVGIDSGLCSNYLTTLMSIGIVKKEFPFRDESPKKTLYALEDSMFRFWYRFIPGNMAQIQKGLKNRVYELIMSQIPAFMGGVFEEICKQYLWQENIAAKLPFNFVDLGRWWGNDPIRKCETEIDIIADDAGDNAIFGECKWTNDKIGEAELTELEHQSKLFHYPNRYLFLFAKTGFSSGCIEKAARMGNVSLVTFQEMNQPSI